MIGTKVIAGNFRGTTIGPIPDHIWARPILARIRKSLFDIIRDRLENAAFLDLFSGSGTVGIEALSRDARQVVFVDINPQVKRWIENILTRLQSRNPVAFKNKQVAVHCKDVTRGLRFLGQSFDLIFSGAPYVDQQKKPLCFIADLLKQIESEKLLKKDGWFIAQHSFREEFALPPSWILFRQEKYGDSKLSFFKQTSDFKQISDGALGHV